MPIAKVALPVAADGPFDYWVPEGPSVEAGSIVRVPLGPRTLVGVVVGFAESSAVEPGRLQPVADVIDGPPLPQDVQDLARFVAEYYQDAVGLAFALAVPPLTTSRRKRRDAEPAVTAAPAPIRLNDD